MPEMEIDELDEIGRFHYPFASISWPAGEWDLLNNDRYWQRDREQGVEQVRVPRFAAEHHRL